MENIPGEDASRKEITRFALSFNAYERWFGDLSSLSEMLRPIHDVYQAEGKIPEAVGVDALRAWLFTLVRSAKFTGQLGANLVVKDDYYHPAIPDILRVLRERENDSTKVD